MESNLYQKHSTELVKDILPEEDVKALINEFMISAGINMGSEFTQAALERVINIVRFEYKFLPMYSIASGFKKGSLGLYEPGRLVPRTINGWMNRVAQEYNRQTAHEAVYYEDYSDSSDLNKYPTGSAIILKIDWLNSGIMKISEWDNIPLKELARRIAEGEPHRFQDFKL